MRSEVIPYERRHLEAVIELCVEAEAFTTFASDPERAGRALAGPGAIAVVAGIGRRLVAEVTGFRLRPQRAWR